MHWLHKLSLIFFKRALKGVTFPVAIFSEQYRAYQWATNLLKLTTMGRRYSRIVQSSRLRSAADRYIAYLQGQLDRPSRVGTQGPRTNTKVVYVTPFGFDIPTDAIYQSSVSPDSYTFLQALINGNDGEVAENTTKTVEPVKGFSAARIRVLISQNRTTTVQTSDITGLQYLKYGGNRYSCPFGRKAETDDQHDVFRDIKTAFFTANATAETKRCNLSREKFSYQ